LKSQQKIAKKICLSKLEGADKLQIQKLQQLQDEIMVNSKRKGTTFENELVQKLNDSGFSKVKRAWGSDGRSMGEAPDVDIVADNIKIQAKRRKAIPKWLNLGNCDVVMFREDRGITFVCMTLDDWIDVQKMSTQSE
tara:strand:+ start:913 stop:1323 length:411 start_codon:yes stop_codon:yes gene_type:complete